MNADRWPDAGGCNILCLTDRQLSILRQFTHPRCLSRGAFVVPVFDKWYSYPTEDLWASYVDEVDDLLDKLGKGATVDCQNMQSLLQLIADGVAPATNLLHARSSTSLSAGAVTVTAYEVETGTSAIVTNLAVQYIGTAPASMRVVITRSGVMYPLAEILTPVSARHYVWNGPWYLMYGDVLGVRLLNATAGDDIYLTTNGRVLVLPVLT